MKHLNKSHKKLHLRPILQQLKPIKYFALIKLIFLLLFYTIITAYGLSVGTRRFLVSIKKALRACASRHSKRDAYYYSCVHFIALAFVPA